MKFQAHVNYTHMRYVALAHVFKYIIFISMLRINQRIIFILLKVKFLFRKFIANYDYDNAVHNHYDYDEDDGQ